MLAASIVAQLPELGVLTRKEVPLWWASLRSTATVVTGVARRTIWGGRPQVRAALYMSLSSPPNSIRSSARLPAAAGHRKAEEARANRQHAKAVDHSQCHHPLRHALAQPEHSGRGWRSLPWQYVVSHTFLLELINDAFIEADEGRVTSDAIVP
jgi:hypothetical protein